MNNFTIQMKEYMTKEDYEQIQALEKHCIGQDAVALKLELDYKLGVANEMKEQTMVRMNQINTFMYFEGAKLIAYLGADCFGGLGADMEVNGMVHPDYRRRGVFSQLTELMTEEWRRRGSGELLLLSDRQSESGQAFIRQTGAQHKHSEYEMYLNQNILSAAQIQTAIAASGIQLRKATNQDAREVAQQNAIYFGEAASENEADWIMPETEEKRGLTIYMAELEGKCIGKVHLQLTGEMGGIFGLGVKPEYRGLGYGRAILLSAVEKFKAAGAQAVMLQVAAENANALGLYESCGFETTSTMDYFEMKC